MKAPHAIMWTEEQMPARTMSLFALSVMLALCLAACQPMDGTMPPPLVLLPPTATRSPTAPAPSPTPSRTPIPRPTRADPPKPLAVVTANATSSAWLARAELAPGRSSPEDWRRIQERARGEARVVLYSDTARALTAAESFMRAYAGMAAEAYTLSSHDIHLRLLDDLQRDKSIADVYLVSDAPRTLQLWAQRRLWTYVPDDLSAVLPEPSRDPMLIHHWSAFTLVYNPKVSSQAPIDNWWDLARPEWRGRVVLPDPIGDERTFYLLATIAQHGQEFAQAYRAEFGRELVLDADCINGGYQWIKALLANQPILLPSDADVARLVGNVKADRAYIGLCGSEQYAKVQRGDLALTILYENMTPTVGLRWNTFLSLVDQAPHPNAAKLFVQWLMGDRTGREGYAPWHEPGIYPARSDVPDPKGAPPRQQLEQRLWEIDAAHIVANAQSVRDHIAAHIGRPVGGR